MRDRPGPGSSPRRWRARWAADRRPVRNGGARRVEQRIEDAGQADSPLQQAPLDQRAVLVRIEVTELLVANLVHSRPHGHRLLDPVENAHALPGLDLRLRRMIDE